MVKVATRHFSVQESTGLDHFDTNTPGKIQDVQAFHCGGNDHMI